MESQNESQPVSPTEYNSPEAAQTVTHTAPKHSVLLGPFGLRAGWSALIFLVLAVAAIALATFAAIGVTGQWSKVVQRQHEAAVAKRTGQPAPKHESTDSKPGHATVGEAFQFGGIALATFAMAKIERRRMRVFGISGSRIADLLPGAFWGLVSLSVLVGLLRAMHLLVFDGIAIHGIAILRFGVEWLVMFLFVGLMEEYLTRGYLQFTLTRGFFGIGGGPEPKQRAVAFWCAATVMSLIFACLHLGNGGENFMGLAMVFIAGMVFSYALWRTGSLWWGIGFHMAWDWAQSFLWGVPDSGNLSYGRLFNTHPVGKVLLSGGSDGPEGSVFVIPVMLLVLLAIRMAKPGVQPALEAEI